MIPKGQYRIPFAFKLPMGLPGTFKFTQKNSKKTSVITERIMIEYSIEAYIELPQG